MSSAVSQELNYQPVTLSHGSYQMSKTPPMVGLDATDSITSNSGTESIFEIPPKVWNFDKSYLSFKATPVGGTAGGNITCWSHVDGMPYIRSLQLYTRTGLYLCDINNFNTYMKTISRRSNKNTEIANADYVSNDTAGFFEGLYMNNTVPAANAAGVTGLRPTETEFLATTPYRECAYCIPGTLGSAVTPVVNVQFPFSRIIDSIFMNKDQYFGESVYLRIVWAPTTQVLFRVDNADSDVNPRAAAPVAYNGNLTISQLYLYLAVEQNPIVVQSIMDKFNSNSLSYQIPYIYMNTQTLTNTSTSLQVRYNRGHGSKLRKIIWAPFNGAEATNTTYDNSQITKAGGAAKVLSFHTTINTVRTSQYDYNLLSGDHWLAVKDSLKGSCILSANEHLYNFAHIENFVGTRSTENDSNIDAGLPLDQEIIWQALATTDGSSIRHMVYAVTAKKLTVTPVGIQLV